MTRPPNARTTKTKTSYPTLHVVTAIYTHVLPEQHAFAPIRVRAIETYMVQSADRVTAVAALRDHLVTCRDGIVWEVSDARPLKLDGAVTQITSTASSATT